MRDYLRLNSEPKHNLQAVGRQDFRRPLLLRLNRLEELGVFHGEGLDAYKVTVELTRAEANEEMASILQDGVFFAARGRKKEIQ